MAGPLVKPLNKKLGTSYPTLAAFLDDLELPVLFAHIHQWRLNNANQPIPEAFEDLPGQSIVNEKRAKELIVNRTKERQAADVRNHLNEWKALVPEWAPRVRAELKKYKIPFEVELLRDEGVNLDGNPPLFEQAGDAPQSLNAVGVLQKGERGYLRSLGADTLMLEVWPHVYRLHHRPAGKPVPPGYEAGLTFGSPKFVNGVYVRSPLMANPSYDAWNKAGQPD